MRVTSPTNLEPRVDVTLVHGGDLAFIEEFVELADDQLHQAVHQIRVGRWRKLLKTPPSYDSKFLTSLQDFEYLTNVDKNTQLIFVLLWFRINNFMLRIS